LINTIHVTNQIITSIVNTPINIKCLNKTNRNNKRNTSRMLIQSGSRSNSPQKQNKMSSVLKKMSSVLIMSSVWL